MNPMGMGKDTLVIESGIVPAFVEEIEWQEEVVGKLVEGVTPPHWY